MKLLFLALWLMSITGECYAYDDSFAAITAVGSVTGGIGGCQLLRGEDHSFGRCLFGYGAGFLGGSYLGATLAKAYLRTDSRVSNVFKGSIAGLALSVPLIILTGAALYPEMEDSRDRNRAIYIGVIAASAFWGARSGTNHLAFSLPPLRF